MLQFNVPPGKAGAVMGKCIESAYASLVPMLEKHYSRESLLWPLEEQECMDRCSQIWEEIHRLRDQATFLLSNMVDMDIGHTCDGDDPLSRVIKDAVLLELIDREVGQNIGGAVEVVLHYVWESNLLLRKIPNGRARVYH